MQKARPCANAQGRAVISRGTTLIREALKAARTLAGCQHTPHPSNAGVASEATRQQRLSPRPQGPIVPPRIIPGSHHTPARLMPFCGFTSPSVV